MKSDEKERDTFPVSEIRPEVLSDFDFTDSEIADFPTAVPDYRALKTAADFEAYLSARHLPEKPYGMYGGADITVCRFSRAKNGENILADIERKNAEQGMGNVAIPNTNIRLINYSVCPKCGKVFSFRDLSVYYGSPRSDDYFSGRGEQARNDTRVFCADCETWFLPALVIADKSPKNEVQFLCRNQTMNAIEKYFMSEGKNVLTRNKANILVDTESGNKAVRNDVTLSKMEKNVYHG